MYESKILKLKEVPVFSLADVSQIVSGKGYAKKLLRKLKEKGEIRKIRKDKYTFHEDSFLVSSFIIKPSYISSVSALSYHKLITQIPKDIFCFTTKKKEKVAYISDIRFIHTDLFFGFENQSYQGFKIPIATPEKAIIDSIGIIPISVFEEAISSVNLDRIKEYLKRIKKSSTIKRVGYLLEQNGFDASDLKKKINYKYIYLDPLAKKKGMKNKKWRLIINTK